MFNKYAKVNYTYTTFVSLVNFIMNKYVESNNHAALQASKVKPASSLFKYLQLMFITLLQL